MFIVSTKRFKVRRADGSPYYIANGFVGDIPEDVAESWLIQEAIKEGSISTPNSKADKSIEKAISTSEEKAKTNQRKRETKKKEVK
jgi:hypothetical protein